MLLTLNAEYPHLTKHLEIPHIVNIIQHRIQGERGEKREHLSRKAHAGVVNKTEQ